MDEAVVQSAANRPGTRTEVLVVGGGVIGLFCAYYLSRAGLQVTVVDRAPPEQRCSWGNAGLIVPSHFVPLASPGIVARGLRWLMNPDSPFYIQPRFNRSLFSWLWAFRKFATSCWVNRNSPALFELLQAAAQLYRELQQEDLPGLTLEQEGLLVAFTTREGENECREWLEASRRMGLPARWMAAGQWEELDPGLQLNARGGLYFPEDAHLNPGRLLQALEAQLKQSGVSLLCPAEVQSIELAGGEATVVHTDRGRIRARHVVLAAGSWTPLLAEQLGLSVPVQPGKGYSLTLPLDDVPFRVPLILEEARVAVTPFAGRIRLAGTMELAGLQRSVRLRRVQAIYRAARQALPGLNLPEPLPPSVWVGLRPCTPDGLPIIDRLPVRGKIWLAAGHAMLGVSLAPATGRLLSELVTGSTPFLDPEPFRLARFDGQTP